MRQIVDPTVADASPTAKALRIRGGMDQRCIAEQLKKQSRAAPDMGILPILIDELVDFR